MQEATCFHAREERKVECFLCPHRCVINNGGYGLCRVRRNIDGRLYSLSYGKIVCNAVDPIEKKPVFHLLPGSKSYSIASPGCNFRCKHCQNSGLSQYPLKNNLEQINLNLKPDEVVSDAVAHGCKSISYTYVEPTVFFEFAMDTARKAKERGLKNIWVSNGFFSAEAGNILSGYLDAINIDIKSFDDRFYRQVCGGRLQPVLDSVKRMLDKGVWVEITTLLIPGLNDSDAEIEAIASFIAEAEPNTPWHVSAFRPAYQMTNIPPTKSDILIKARKTGLKKGLKFVYTGNIPGLKGENTICPECQNTIIERMGYSIGKNLLAKGCCPFCGAKVPGIWG